MSKVEDCKLAMYNAKKAARAEVNLFCEIVGLPKNDHNDFIADDPHGIVDFQEGYMFFSMSDIHVVIAGYEHWLELYKTNEEIARVVREWYYWSLDWHEKHSLEEPRWVSVKERLPEMTKETKSYGESPIVYVSHVDGKIGVMYYSYSYERWEIGGGGMPAPLYWKPIIAPEQEAERSKGCPNLRSWLMGWRPDPKDVLPQYKEHQAKELTAAHARVEAAKEELRNPWISIEERLPDIGQKVITITNKGKMLLVARTTQPPHKEEGGWRWEHYIGKVTHWMSIPELKN